MSSTFVGAAATGMNSGAHAGAVYGGLPTSMGSALNSGVHLASNEPINSTSMLNGSGDHNVELISQVCLNDLPALGVREPHQAATVVPEALRSTDLPTLPLPGTDQAALQFGDWITLTAPLIGDVSPRPGNGGRLSWMKRWTCTTGGWRSLLDAGAEGGFAAAEVDAGGGQGNLGSNWVMDEVGVQRKLVGRCQLAR